MISKIGLSNNLVIAKNNGNHRLLTIACQSVNHDNKTLHYHRHLEFEFQSVNSKINMLQPLTLSLLLTTKFPSTVNENHIQQGKKSNANFWIWYLGWHSKTIIKSRHDQIIIVIIVLKIWTTYDYISLLEFIFLLVFTLCILIIDAVISIIVFEIKIIKLMLTWLLGDYDNNHDNHDNISISLNATANDIQYDTTSSSSVKKRENFKHHSMNFSRFDEKIHIFIFNSPI